MESLSRVFTSLPLDGKIHRTLTVDTFQIHWILCTTSVISTAFASATQV